MPPEGEFTGEAKTRLTEIYWKGTKAQNTLVAYAVFAHRFSDSPYAAEALGRFRKCLTERCKPLGTQETTFLTPLLDAIRRWGAQQVNSANFVQSVTTADRSTFNIQGNNLLYLARSSFLYFSWANISKGDENITIADACNFDGRFYEGPYYSCQ